jgi:glycosyltransferase involved in cell wall biosynthesis
MMKKIFFVIPSLAGGGAEKVISIILNHLDRQKFLPYLILFEKKGEFLDNVPSDVKIYNLKKKNRYSFLKLVFRLAGFINKEKPDIVVSFLEYANIVSLLAEKLVKNKNIKWIISERNLPSAEFSNMRLAKIKILLHRILDKTADLVIVNSSQTKEELVNKFCVPSEKIVVIFNPVEIEKIYMLSKERIPNNLKKDNGEIILISVGRLSKQKGYQFLLKAFAEVVKNFKCKLIILGEGEERTEIERLIKELKIENYVILKGFVQNPYPYIANSDIFVLSSLWEGLPNALIEAMVLSKPVIATRCNKVIEEIIEDSKNGLLVPPGDVESLKNAIIKLIREKELRIKFSEANKKLSYIFDYKFVVKKYEEEFLKKHY